MTDGGPDDLPDRKVEEIIAKAAPGLNPEERKKVAMRVATMVAQYEGPKACQGFGLCVGEQTGSPQIARFL